MQKENFDNDDGLYELLNADNNLETITTGRTDDLIFNLNPINWHRNKYNCNQYLTNDHLNDNNSSVVFPENDQLSSFTVQSALPSNAIDLPICKTYELTPRSHYYNDKFRENVDKFLPHNLTKDLKQFYNVSCIRCPECDVKNLSNSDWCLSCGLFLIRQNTNSNANSENLIGFKLDNNPLIDAVDDVYPMETPFNVISNRIINDSIEFDKLYKIKTTRNDELNEGTNSYKQLNGEKSKRNLSDLEENKDNSNKKDASIMNIDICESANHKSTNAGSVSKFPIIPPLNLSDLDNNSSSQSKLDKITENSTNKYREETCKENEKKPMRKWISSSMAWEDRPINLLKKKPGKYYRNKLSSCTNRIGLHVYPSKIDNTKVLFSDEDNDDISNDQFTACSDWIDINADNENSYLTNNINHHHHMVADNQLDDNLQNHLELYRQVVKSMGISDEFNKNNCNISDIVPSSDLINLASLCNWQCLPAEIWIKVMMYLLHSELSKLQQTCRRIYLIGLDSQLWRCITLFRHNNLTDQHIISIAHKMPKELHFKNCLGTSITFNGLKEMFKICGNGIVKLSFISCSKGALEGDQFLVLSATFCPNVTHINASYLMNLQDSTLISMTEGFTKIVSINLMGAHSISNESIKSLIKNHRSSLTSLDLYGCFRLNSQTLRILEECLNLRSLALGSINKLKRTSMVDLLRKLSQLKNLDLRGTMNLIDDPLLAQICALCPYLQQIVLTNSCLVGDTGLNSLAGSNVCKTLKVLDVCGCLRITDKGVEDILKSCQNLEDLDISCTGITGRITKLFNMYPPPNLKCLRVNNNKLISETELASIVTSSKKLNTIYMCGITSIDTWRSLETKYKHILFKHE